MVAFQGNRVVRIAGTFRAVRGRINCDPVSANAGSADFAHHHIGSKRGELLVVCCQTLLALQATWFVPSRRREIGK